jgi:hypothetical protein
MRHREFGLPSPGRRLGAIAMTWQASGDRSCQTILALLGLDPGALQAVRIEHTAVLPGLR